jgi:hypothetical protein
VNGIVQEVNTQRVDVMKSLFSSGRALIPWLALAVPLFWMGLLISLGYLAPALFCKPVNPGAREFICAAQYTDSRVRLLQLSGYCVWILLLLTGGAELFLKRATWPAITAWLVSALLMVGLVILALSLQVDCYP